MTSLRPCLLPNQIGIALGDDAWMLTDRKSLREHDATMSVITASWDVPESRVAELLLDGLANVLQVYDPDDSSVVLATRLHVGAVLTRDLLTLNPNPMRGAPMPVWVSFRVDTAGEVHAHVTPAVAANTRALPVTHHEPEPAREREGETLH